MKGIDRFLQRCKVQEGPTLIVGSKIHEGTDKQDRRKLYPNAVGVDMQAGKGVDWVANIEQQTVGEFSHIECTSVLEHSRRPWLLCSNLERMLVDGGTLFVMVPWVWREHDYPGDYFRYTAEGVRSLFNAIEWEREAYIVEEQLYKRVPRMTAAGIRWLARSEIAMFGRKCS